MTAFKIWILIPVFSLKKFSTGNLVKGIKLSLVDIMKGLSTSYSSYLKFIRSADWLFYEKAGFALCFPFDRCFVDMFRGKKIKYKVLEIHSWLLEDGNLHIRSS